MDFNKYIKTSIRYITLHKTYTVVNLIGLTSGLCVAFFTLLYVNFELSYDTFNAKSKRIYRVVTDVETPTGINYESAPAALGPALKNEFAEVLSAARIYLDDYIIQKDQQNFGTVKLAYADSSIFDVFTFPLTIGNPKSVLQVPFSMVISETAALKYFGSYDCIGKTLTLNGNQPALVTGLMKDIPLNSHIRTDIFLSLSSLLDLNHSYLVQNWNRYGFYTYLLLAQDSKPQSLQSKLSQFIKRHSHQQFIQQSLKLEPLNDVYLKGKPRGNKAGSSLHGSYLNVYVFSAITFFVLLIACFNFVNLSTAFSMERLREIGIRKVIGATKKQLAIQFLIDGLLLSLISFAMAVVLCTILIPYFNQLIGKTISVGIMTEAHQIGWLLVIALFTGLISGIYPALYLSSLDALQSLKGRFATSLFISTLVVYRQLNYMQSQELGFKKDHLLIVDFQFDDRIREHSESIKSQLLEIPEVQKVSFTSYLPGKPNKKFPLRIENAGGSIQEFQSDSYFVDNDFITQFQIGTLEGRNFDKNLATDLDKSMIVNEAMVRSLGYHDPSKLIGKSFSQLEINKANEGTVIGVVKDFHFQSFHEPIKPLAIRMVPTFFTYIVLTLSSPNLQESIRVVEKKWGSIAGTLPFSYFFADDAYDEQYKLDQRFGRLFLYFSGLAILISCLGLLGLSIYSFTIRKKEIGIRKIIGASILQIINILTWDLMKLVLTAYLISAPIASLIMNRWLQNFAYHVSINIWILLIAGIAATLITFITVGVYALKVAITKPINSLKLE